MARKVIILGKIYFVLALFVLHFVACFAGLRQDDPDPASYSITKAFKYNNDKRSHATGKYTAFDASERKFGRIYDFAGALTGIDSPSVGTYDLPQLHKQNGKTIPYAERFPIPAFEKRPGPQTYSFHPIVGEALYRGKTSHNLRLMKEVVKRDTACKLKAPKRPTNRKRVLRSFMEEDSYIFISAQL